MIWEYKEIREVGKVITGKTPPMAQELYYKGGSEFFISPKDLSRDGVYVSTTRMRVTPKALEKFKNQVIPKDSILFTSLSYGFGKMGIATKNSLTNQQINTIVVDLEKSHPKFLFYLLKVHTPFIFSYNSGIDTPIVPKSVFEKIKLPFPPLSVQKKIAAILTAYDDLIEANNRRIQLLESIAEEIYREWFVRLRFPGHEKAKVVKGVPEGWKKLSLDDMGNYLNGYAFKPNDWKTSGIPIIKIKEMTSGVTSSTPRNSGEKINEKYLILDGDIVFSWSATLLVKIWGGGNGLLNQHLFKVTPDIDISREFLYHSIKSSLVVFDTLTTGATMKHIKRKELKFVKVNVPPVDIMNIFSSYVSPLIEKGLVLKRENENLIETRDKLLPRLISGKLSVENLNIHFPPSMEETAA